MSVSEVRRSITTASTDHTITAAEMKEIEQSAGKKVSREEFAEIENLVDSNTGFMSIFTGTVNIENDAEAAFDSFSSDYRSAMNTYSNHKKIVENRSARLDLEAAQLMAPSIRSVGFSGTEIPAAVKKIINTAFATGASAYDVSELSEPKQFMNGATAEHDYDNQTFEVKGLYSPYPQDIEASGTMRFSNTEITPQKLMDDMNTVQSYTQISGYKQKEYTNWRTGEVTKYTEPQYETITGKGTGHVTAHYDEDNHSDMNARGFSGQKWANNYAILADGSLHALPAMRRTESTNRILTNPSLARGKKMLFNGHIEIRSGVVVGLGMSGRLQKLAVKGEHKFVDPLAILKAHGFEIAPGLYTQMEGSHGQPDRDEVNHTIG